ncbi:hypothetical protein E3N88_31811 [Mikania micrantha]|uniref:Uncharacterized protein n=1 Tax=Mikania micrantha TaxID=192012 RepID=A0A5N6M720_9ASTR|nr:hypothetical protein E3N88_31811 [Mikania micrantha]
MPPMMLYPAKNVRRDEVQAEEGPLAEAESVDGDVTEEMLEGSDEEAEASDRRYVERQRHRREGDGEE